MDPERWHKIKTLFEAASALDGAERTRFVAEACGGDAELAAEVNRLLPSHNMEDDFMEQPAVAEAASMFEATIPLTDRTTGQSADGSIIAGTVIAGRYRIHSMLGKGGMGEVYKAEDLKLSQTVALKFLSDRIRQHPGALERFHAEVRNARQVSHANVCRVFDIGEVAGRYFLSMEYIHGDDLSSMLRRIGRLPSDKAVVIARQLCFGLAAIHDAGILHRDLKPANVIIDDNGRARITDFGIAGIEEEMGAGGEIRVGTPAYMSPEQISGCEVTQRSDIYALGLLLYEMFTGKQTFQSSSARDLLEKHQTTAPTNPSDVLRDIDPIVEKTILQCIEKEPRDRPEHALQVAMMLPGGNPLEAAMLAGETPSPEMVAAAPKKGALRPGVAITYLSAVVAAIIFLVAFSSTVREQEWLPLEKSPEVLAERSTSILSRLGYSEPALDTAYGFKESGSDYHAYAEGEGFPDRWDKLRSGQPAIVKFWYRTSPRYLQPSWSETVSSDDPPDDVAGMTQLRLDPRGRLLEFSAIPPQVRPDAAASADVDWSVLFTEAGLSINNYRQTETRWVPPFFADRVVAWEGVHVDHPTFPVRIEAASFGGKPVYFQVVAPWDRPLRQEEARSSSRSRAAAVILILVILFLIAAAAFLARRNLRQGRSDNRGALRISLAVLFLSMTASLVSADHIPDLPREISILFLIIGDSLFVAALIGLAYLALEPYVRRRWPNLIISWSRLLVGDYTDPMVGRDILIGGLLGLGHTVLIYFMYLVPHWLGKTPQPNPNISIGALRGLKYVVSSFLMAPASGIFGAFAALLLLILLVAVFKKRWVAIAILWFLQTLVLSLFFAGPPSLLWLVPAGIATLFVVGIARYGLLAMVSFQIFFTLSFHTGLSGDITAFYFSGTVLTLMLLLGLAVYGFYISLAKQRLSADRFLRDLDI